MYFALFMDFYVQVYTIDLVLNFFFFFVFFFLGGPFCNTYLHIYLIVHKTTFCLVTMNITLFHVFVSAFGSSKM